MKLLLFFGHTLKHGAIYTAIKQTMAAASSFALDGRALFSPCAAIYCTPVSGFVEWARLLQPQSVGQGVLHDGDQQPAVA